MKRITPWSVNNEGKLVKRFKLRTFAASVSGPVLKVQMPPYLEYSCDLGAESRASSAYEFIRANGVECSENALNALLRNF